MVEKQKKQLELEQITEEVMMMVEKKQLELKHKKQLELERKKSQKLAHKKLYLERKKWEKEMKNTLVTMSALAALAILIFFSIYQKIFLGTPFFGDFYFDWVFCNLP